MDTPEGFEELLRKTDEAKLRQFLRHLLQKTGTEWAFDENTIEEVVQRGFDSVIEGIPHSYDAGGHLVYDPADFQREFVRLMRNQKGMEDDDFGDITRQ